MEVGADTTAVPVGSLWGPCGGTCVDCMSPAHLFFVPLPFRALSFHPGSLVRFDFQTTLVSVVSSVALFAIASLIVSFLAFSVVPERLYYQKARERAVRRPFFKKK
jgi:hypothetical protein